MPAQYLERYATPDSKLASTLAGRWDHVLVVPAYDESIALLDGILPATAQGQRVLCIVVVNARADAPAAARATNAALLADLRAKMAGPRQVEHAWLGAIADGVDVLAVDRTSDARVLPAKQGVGLARRIGCDLALALRHSGRIGSRWIHTTDADVTLPVDYFTAAATAADDSVALTYPFWHDADLHNLDGQALARYELSLRYYVLGLRWSRSPYAFHTVGSTLALDALSYARVRGMPARQAGEDFYVLSKLAKLGRVEVPASSPIRIRQRASHRVPFGTGPATRRIAELLARGDDLAIYHPGCFELLRATLHAITNAIANQRECTIAEVPCAADRTTPLRAAWERIELDTALPSLLAGATTPGTRLKRFHEWFDGFRTLAFIHAARDAGLSNVPWRDAISEAAFALVPDGSSDSISAPGAKPEISGAKRSVEGGLIDELRRALFAAERGRDRPWPSS